MRAMGIGSDTQRVDGLDKVMGRPLYGADRNLARIAYAIPVTATIGKGRIRQLDTVAAERVAGVLTILTYRNMDQLAPIAFAFAMGGGCSSAGESATDDHHATSGDAGAADGATHGDAGTHDSGHATDGGEDRSARARRVRRWKSHRLGRNAQDASFARALG